MKSKVFALLALVSALASTPAVAVPLIPEVRPRVGFGVDPSRVEAKGYGEAHPLADNSTEEGRQRNRRVDVRVTEK